MCIYNAIINHDSNLWCGNNISYEMILVAPILNFVHGVVKVAVIGVMVFLRYRALV